jgi:hypothetical protein
MTKNSTINPPKTPAESDRKWFKRRPLRTHRMRPLNPFEINLHRKKKPTHVVVMRQPGNHLAKLPVDLTGFDRSYVRTMNWLKDSCADASIDSELSYIATQAAC